MSNCWVNKFGNQSSLQLIKNNWLYMWEPNKSEIKQNETIIKWKFNDTQNTILNFFITCTYMQYYRENSG